MRIRRVLAIFLAAAMILAASGETAQAQRSSSSSGRSFSSGSSSSSSRSYSSGSSSKPSSSSSSSSGRSYSSGSSSKPSSSGSSSSGRSYSSGSSSSKPSGSSTPSIKPGKSSFDSIGSKEQMKVESRQLYTKGTTPKTEYKTASGTTAKIDPKDAKIERLRGQLDQQKWVNREQRQQQFYGAYYSRPVVVYNDPYPSMFWWWMLDRSLEERALWAYHHQSSMDQARYREMCAKDAQLDARVRQLEAQKVARDPNFAPKGMDPDLMYTNDYVDAVYNPHGTLPDDDHGESSVTGWGVLKFIFWCCVIGFVIWLIWFVFIREAY